MEGEERVKNPSENPPHLAMVLPYWYEWDERICSNSSSWVKGIPTAGEIGLENWLLAIIV